MHWTRRERDGNRTCKVKNQIGSMWKGHVQGKEARKRQEFLAYQICDPLLQWWMSKASSDLSLLLICLAGALFRAEQGWTREHVTPVAARSNPLTVDSWACGPRERGSCRRRRRRTPQTTTTTILQADTCLRMRFSLCFYFLRFFLDLTKISPRTSTGGS